eukprot:6209717-Pleurochrysis_carterae.AAC.1
MAEAAKLWSLTYWLFLAREGRLRPQCGDGPRTFTSTFFRPITLTTSPTYEPGSCARSDNAGFTGGLRSARG